MPGCDTPGRSPARDDQRDERISAQTAAEILGTDRATVYRLMAKRRLPTYGKSHTFDQLRRGDVEELRNRGERIPLAEAAEILGRSVRQVRELITAGKLDAWSGSRRPVFRADVQRLAETMPPSNWPPWEGRLSTGAVAERLGKSRSRIYGLARDGLLPAIRDAAGRYWVDPHHLEMYVRAKRLEAEAEGRPTP
ncbi:hypothetical protein ACFV9C_41430 [Kribbella sp. NPDC059898]|uniref:hypothetical protein n=1 Tax=Kribbella sp. NPDC059898 TaxID=3346995 RepID=UPI00365BCE53